MRARRRGGILFVLIAGWSYAAPYQANYAATKAYILSLAQALNYELKPEGVDVSVLSPGLTAPRR